jgi:peptide/nickel transport system substrate-binding protein
MVILGLVSMVAAACGGSKDKTNNAKSTDKPGIVTGDNKDNEGTPVDGGSVTMGLEAESAGWQPCVDSWSESGTMVGLSIYDPLMSRGTDGKVHPYLAQSLDPDPSGLAWTLKLRPGVKFHDGTDLTADIIKQEFDIAKDPASRCASALKPVSSVDVVDPLTV